MSYLRPHRLEDALDWLAAESPLVMAGCTDIYPLHQTPSLDGPLLDITGLDELPELAPYLPDLQDMEEELGALATQPAPGPAGQEPAASSEPVGEEQA